MRLHTRTAHIHMAEASSYTFSFRILNQQLQQMVTFFYYSTRKSWRTMMTYGEMWVNWILIIGIDGIWNAKIWQMAYVNGRYVTPLTFLIIIIAIVTAVTGCIQPLWCHVSTQVTCNAASLIGKHALNGTRNVLHLRAVAIVCLTIIVNVKTVFIIMQFQTISTISRTKDDEWVEYHIKLRTL